MPELPEVETIVRGLAGKVIGHRIEKVYLVRKDILHGHNLPIESALQHRRIQNVFRIGKLIHIDMGADRSLVVHLGMTGRLFIADHDDPVEQHTHMIISFLRRRSEVRFCDPRRFGAVWLLDGHDEGKKWIGRRLPVLGPDALDMSLPNFSKTLKRQRQIKAFLLDQQIIAGVGNIYCDESLHRAGIHPLRRACDLDPSMVRDLYKKLRLVLNQAIRARGSSVSDYRTADNETGTYQHNHRVYKREGKPCKKCGTGIQRIVAAGRGTHICPQCQPLFAIKPTCR